MVLHRLSIQITEIRFLFFLIQLRSVMLKLFCPTGQVSGPGLVYSQRKPHGPSSSQLATVHWDGALGPNTVPAHWDWMPNAEHRAWGFSQVQKFQSGGAVALLPCCQISRFVGSPISQMSLHQGRDLARKPGVEHPWFTCITDARKS